MIQRKRARSVLNQVRTYSIHSNGRRIGGYTITKLDVRQLGCFQALVGWGHMPWGRPGTVREGEEASVLQFIALSGPPVAQDFKMRAGYVPSRQESRFLASLAENRLRKYLQDSPGIVLKAG